MTEEVKVARIPKSASLLIVFLAVAGCNTMRFEVGGTPKVEPSHVERKAFFLWGLTPTRRVDLRDHCPAGVAAIREEQNFVDGLLNVITLGIYAPRTSEYYCREEAR